LTYLEGIDQEQLKVGPFTEHPKVGGQCKIVQDYIENPEIQK